LLGEWKVKTGNERILPYIDQQQKMKNMGNPQWQTIHSVLFPVILSVVLQSSQAITNVNGIVKKNECKFE